MYIRLFIYTRANIPLLLPTHDHHHCSFYVHHVLGQRHLLRAGVDLSRGLVVSPNPFLFLLSMILCRTVIWHFLNALMYRIRIDYFIVAIPFILLLGVGDEVELCERAASMHTGTAGVAYGYAVEFGRLASASLRPILPSSSSSTPMHTYTANSSTCTTESSSSNSTVARIASDCRLLHFYLLMLGGWLLPIYFILRLEHQVWYEYLNEDPANISWPGGPGVEEIAEGVEELRRQEERKRRLREAGSDWRMWLFFLVSAGVLWRLLDGVVNSERYSEIVWSWLL